MKTTAAAWVFCIFQLMLLYMVIDLLQESRRVYLLGDSRRSLKLWVGAGVISGMAVINTIVWWTR